jgi:hypothetical protein
MGTISVDSQIKKYMLQLNVEDKQSLLSFLKSMLKSKDDAGSPMSLEEYNQELNDAVSRIDKGEFYTQDEAKKIAESWF